MFYNFSISIFFTIELRLLTVGLYFVAPNKIKTRGLVVL